MTGQAPRRSVLARVLIFGVRLYQTWVSPMKLPSCRFEPSCSSYTVEAIEVHGAVRGTALSVWRLAKCAPWHSGGWDPVPAPGHGWPHWARRDGGVRCDGVQCGGAKTRSE